MAGASLAFLAVVARWACQIGIAWIQVQSFHGVPSGGGEFSGALVVQHSEFLALRFVGHGGDQAAGLTAGLSALSALFQAAGNRVGHDFARGAVRTVVASIGFAFSMAASRRCSWSSGQWAFGLHHGQQLVAGLLAAGPRPWPRPAGSVEAGGG